MERLQGLRSPEIGLVKHVMEKEVKATIIKSARGVLVQANRRSNNSWVLACSKIWKLHAIHVMA